MIRHYFVHFVRNLARQKLYSFVNLLGLTASVTCALMIYLYVRHELSYDRFHHHADRIYRINQSFIWGEDTDIQFASTGPGVAYAIQAEVPEVELLTSIHTPGTFIVTHVNSGQDKISFEEESILAADTNFFRFFNFSMLEGNPKSALREANTLVMTASTAKKYFGGESPLGKLVRLEGLSGQGPQTYEVTGVLSDLPQNSYLQFDILLSMKSFPVEKLRWSWVWTQLETYVRLHEGADIEVVRARLKDIPRKHAEQTLRLVMNTTFDEYIRSGKKWDLFLQPLTGIHLPDEKVMNRLSDSGNIKTVWSLAGAAVVIVLLACINFMNLSTARFTRRAREAGIRKVLGLGKAELWWGYFFEALMFCVFASVFAMAITQALLPFFNAVTGKGLTVNFLGDSKLMISIVALIAIMALVASSYPAWFLNRFNAAAALKGKIRGGAEGKSFRNALVTFQFSLSIFLMISTAIVFQQLNFISKKDLGFHAENLVVLKHIESVNNRENLAREALNVPGIIQASQCSSLPPHIFGGDKFSAEGMRETSFPLNFTSGDEDFIRTLGISLKIGRTFDRSNPADSFRVILNESAVRKIGWPLDESVIGRKLKYPNFEDATFEVAGVVSDFNYWSLHTRIEPLGIFHVHNTMINAGDRRYLALRVRAQDRSAWEHTLSGLAQLWKVHAGDLPFEYRFVDDVFAETFRSQQQLGKVLSALAALALTIAGLGLLGMMLFALEQRMKEIGIRKISGASTAQLLWLISGGYTKLIVIAFVLAAPLAWWFMNQWLEDFAYRITPSVFTFVLTGAAAVAIGFLITAYHAIRAARANPVDVLRDE